MGTKKARSVAMIAGSAAAVVLAALAGGTIWASRAQAARSQVEVLVGSNAFSCANPAEVTVVEQTFGVSDDFSYPVPALKLTKHLDCTFTFIINNTGDTDVSLTGLNISMMDSGNSSGAHMPRLTHNLIERVSDGSIDANFDLEQVLAAGQATEISAVVERSPDAWASAAA